MPVVSEILPQRLAIFFSDLAHVPTVYGSMEKILVVDDELFNIQSLKIIIQGSLKKMNRRIDILDAFIDSANNG